MNTTKFVDEAPYHPGYEDAVVAPAPKYTGIDPAKMIWKPKPLSDEEIIIIRQDTSPKTTDNWADTLAFARAIERRHGIK